jgi:ligand-binding sensor domain-containing protein
MGAVSMLSASAPLLALNPALAVSQYAHTAWTVRDGFSLGNVYAMAQTPDGYLWLGTELGCFASMAFAFSPGNHLLVSSSPIRTSIACSSHATAVCGLARLADSSS